MADGRQPVVEAGGRRLEGGQVKNLQDRWSAKRIVDLGPRKNSGSQCGSRGEVLRSRNAWRSSTKSETYGWRNPLYTERAGFGGIGPKENASKKGLEAEKTVCGWY